MEQQRLLLAVLLTTFILIGWQYFFPAPKHELPVQNPASISSPASTFSSAATSSESIESHVSRADLISQGYENGNRVAISNSLIHGSINLQGARIDDLALAEYKTDLDKDGSEVVLFSPSNTLGSYFAEFGWIQIDDGANKIELPNSKTVWRTSAQKLSADQEVTLFWRNDQNIKFMISFVIDDRYMFHVKQSVQNDSDRKITLHPYAILSRSRASSDANNMIIHEGAIGVFDNKLEEIGFSDIEDKKKLEYTKKQGWVGFSDKYWLAAFISSKDQYFDSNISHFKFQNAPRFQVDVLSNASQIASGQTVSCSVQLFAGAKKLALLDTYQKQYDIPLFDRAVDFGALYFITKPIFLLLSYFYSLIGNFGLAILLLTVVIKMLLFPLAYKGFMSMNRLKMLQPKMAQLKERHEGDGMAFQKALLALYKEEKVNPVSGCLPIILQMPVFFALYKVLYVTIEMRHAEFFWWIKDLSAPDPTNLFTLFGLLPWHSPAFLAVGVLPILMAWTMFIQQSLNPAPADPIQAKVMKFMPLFFLFMFSSFPSGLVLYWAWSNILSIVQQLIIKKVSE